MCEKNGKTRSIPKTISGLVKIHNDDDDGGGGGGDVINILIVKKDIFPFMLYSLRIVFCNRVPRVLSLIIITQKGKHKIKKNVTLHKNLNYSV